MLEGGTKHLYLVAGDNWTMGATDSENIETIDHVDVLEDASVTVTCDWLLTSDAGTTWAPMVDETITLVAGRYDMSVEEITVVSGIVHLVKA